MQSAPSSIWVFRVPEESKLKTSSTLGATVLYCSEISFRVSVREAAAKTVSWTLSPEASEEAAAEEATASEEAEAA